jgi:hypothetical protein
MWCCGVPRYVLCCAFCSLCMYECMYDECTVNFNPGAGQRKSANVQASMHRPIPPPFSRPLVHLPRSPPFVPLLLFLHLALYRSHVKTEMPVPSFSHEDHRKGARGARTEGEGQTGRPAARRRRCRCGNCCRRRCSPGRDGGWRW